MSDARELTVLFADVSGSTLLYEKLDAASALQATERCMKRMERAVTAQGGRTLKAVGDELMAVFVPADDAFQAACDMQQTVSALPPLAGVTFTLRIGFQRGPVMEAIDACEGDAVEDAVRLTGMAKPGQILTNDSTQRTLSARLQACTRTSGTWKSRDETCETPMFEVIWQNQSDLAAAIQPLESQEEPEQKHVTLAIRYADQQFIVDDARPTLRLGRDHACEIEIRAPHASRRHARIELRGRQFVLIDESTHGTYVTLTEKPEILLRHGEMTLRDSGTLSFATPATTANADCAWFEYR